MAITKVTNRVLDDSSVGVAQLSAGAVPIKLGNEIGALNFRNKIINGGFDIWQRGTSFNSPAHAQYTADRWRYVRFASGTTTNISRQLFTPGQTAVPDNPKHFMRMTVSTPGDIGLSQPIESVYTLAGKTVTYSFWAKASTNTTLNAVYVIQWSGTGGVSPNSALVSGSVNAPITTSWTKITGTITLPNLGSFAIGTDNNDYLEFRIDLAETFTGTFDIAQVQVEEGPVATPFEQRPIGLELSLCQRYYELGYAYLDNNFSPAIADAHWRFIYNYKQTKRTSTPVVTRTGGPPASTAPGAFAPPSLTNEHCCVVSYNVPAVNIEYDLTFTIDGEL